MRSYSGILFAWNNCSSPLEIKLSYCGYKISFMFSEQQYRSLSIHQQGWCN